MLGTRLVVGSVVLCLCTIAAPPDAQHEHMQMGETDGWAFMHDGVVFGIFNRQGGPRGATEFKAPNWWMGMLTRPIGPSRLTLTGMFSLDPATAGRNGYAELFQA